MKNYSQPRITLAHPSSSVPLEKASLPSDQTGTVEEPNLEMQKIIYAECFFFFFFNLFDVRAVSEEGIRLALPEDAAARLSGRAS